jgi:hypothetical protein
MEPEIAPTRSCPKAAVDQLEQRLDVDLGRKERELAASPSERLDMLQDEIDQSSGLDAVREKIERSAAQRTPMPAPSSRTPSRCTPAK